MKLDLETGGLNLRALKRPESPNPIDRTPKTQQASNKGAFAEALEKAERITRQSDSASADLMSGQVELHEAMVRMEKADLMLKLGTTVRNKLLEAYQQLLSSAGN